MAVIIAEVNVTSKELEIRQRYDTYCTCVSRFLVVYGERMEKQKKVAIG